MIFINDEKMMDYNGGRVAKDIVGWLRNKLGPHS